jgi:hypothetical protein
MLPDFERADAIGSYCGNLKTRTFGEERRIKRVLFGRRTRWLT